MPRLPIMMEMAKRDWLITRTYRTAFAFDFVFTFINLIAFYFISEAFGEIDQDLGSAPSYFAFASVGMAVTVVIQSAAIGLSDRVREEQLTGSLEYLAAQPITSTEISLGLTTFSFLLATVRAAIYIVGSMLLIEGGTRPDWIGFVLVLVAVGLAVSGLGVTIGALILVFKRGQSAAALVVFSLGMLGGAIFPIEVLPLWLEIPARIVPTRFAFEGIRSALFEGGGWADDLGWLLLTAAVIVPAGIFIFHRALALSKRRGSLAEY